MGNWKKIQTLMKKFKMIFLIIYKNIIFIKTIKLIWIFSSNSSWGVREKHNNFILKLFYSFVVCFCVFILYIHLKIEYFYRKKDIEEIIKQEKLIIIIEPRNSFIGKLVSLEQTFLAFKYIFIWSVIKVFQRKTFY